MPRPTPAPAGPRLSERPYWSRVLRALREAAGVTQEGWTARLGCGRSTLQRWEAGEAVPDAVGEQVLVATCHEKGLFRAYAQGSLAGLTLTPEWLHDLLAGARLGQRRDDTAARMAASPPPAAAAAPTEPHRDALPTGTVTLLMTDIEGSTRLLHALGDRYAEVLSAQRQLLRAAVATRGGVEVDATGDAFFAAFARATDAVVAAVAVQRALATHPWPAALSPREDAGDRAVPMVRVRMGLHTGQPACTPHGYVGLDVHRVARICAAGHGGQILLSQPCADLVRQDLPAGVRLRAAGSHRLKDLAEPEHLSQVVTEDLPADFPPLRSLSERFGNLPAPVSSFVGREQERAEVTGLLGTTRLLMLTGPGGVGKTRLALAVAAELATGAAAGPPPYPDGVWLVELAALGDTALVPRAVLAALGEREPPGRPLLQALVDVLNPRRLLLVLDNCEHLAAACAALVEALLAACPGLVVLATSREPLGIGGEAVFRVPSLGLPVEPTHAGGTTILPANLAHIESVQLFVERARAVAPAFVLTKANAAAVAEICRRLDGIPLALELAAARVRVLTVEQIAARLDDRFRLLTGGSRAAPSRQQTLRAAIDWSYELLTVPERMLFDRLSVFAGGCTLEMATSVCGDPDTDELDILDLLTGLVDKSLVLREDGPGADEARYRLLETLRQYGTERLAATGTAAVFRARHRDAYLALAEHAAPWLSGAAQSTWLARLEREHDNLRAALTWCLTDPAGADAGLRLATAIAIFWEVRGHIVEGCRWLESLLVQDLGRDTGARARALRVAGWLARRQGDYVRACARLEESLAIFRRLEDLSGAAAALQNLGAVAQSRGEFATARALLEESLAISRRLGDALVMARALNNLGIVALEAGDAATARAYWQESLVLRRDLNDRRGVAIVLGNLGIASRQLGDLADARRFGEEALALARELGDQRAIASAFIDLGSVACSQQETDAAWSFLTEGIGRYHEMGLKAPLVDALGRMPAVMAARGDLSAAARLLGATAAARSQLGVPLSAETRPAHEAAEAAARAHLDEEAFASAWAEGQSLRLDAAVALVLDDAGHTMPERTVQGS